MITSCVCSHTQTLGHVGVVTKQALGMHVQVSLNGKRLEQQKTDDKDVMCSYMQVGVVTKQTVTMYVQVSVNGKRWIYSPKCLIPASEDELPEHYGTVHIQYNGVLF